MDVFVCHRCVILISYSFENVFRNNFDHMRLAVDVIAVKSDVINLYIWIYYHFIILRHGDFVFHQRFAINFHDF
jgi:hypothetical protein